LAQEWLDAPGINLSEAAYTLIGVRMLERFRTYVMLMKHREAKMYDPSGYDVSKDKRRANDWHDADLAMLVGRDFNVAGRPVVLVTTDNAIHTAAKAANCDDLVVRPMDYLADIGWAP